MQALLLALVAVVGISVPMKPSMRTFHRFLLESRFQSTLFHINTSDVAGKLTYLLYSKEKKR